MDEARGDRRGGVVAMPLGRVRGSVPRARDGGLELQDSGRGDRAKVPERLAPLLDVLGDRHGNDGAD